MVCKYILTREPTRIPKGNCIPGILKSLNDQTGFFKYNIQNLPATFEKFDKCALICRLLSEFYAAICFSFPSVESIVNYGHCIRGRHWVENKGDNYVSRSFQISFLLPHPRFTIFHLQSTYTKLLSRHFFCQTMLSSVQHWRCRNSVTSIMWPLNR